MLCAAAAVVALSALASRLRVLLTVKVCYRTIRGVAISSIAKHEIFLQIRNRREAAAEPIVCHMSSLNDRLSKLTD